MAMVIEVVKLFVGGWVGLVVLQKLLIKEGRNSQYFFQTLTPTDFAKVQPPTSQPSTKGSYPVWLCLHQAALNIALMRLVVK